MNSFRLVVGLFVVFGLFHWSATALGSDRGQHGLMVGGLVAGATAATQWLVLRRRFPVVRQLGLGPPLFAFMPWPVALAAVLLSVVISFPLAHLYELAGHTIWAPALVHFVIQGTVKVIVLPESAASLVLVWMIASAVVPMLVFAVKVRNDIGAQPR